MANQEEPAKKTIIDVSHADDVKPTDSSKPILVTNRPILKDPMVLEVKEAKEAEAQAPELEKSKQVEKVEVSTPETDKPKEELKVELTSEEKPAESEKTPSKEAETPATQESFSEEQPDKPKDPEDEIKKEEEAVKRDEALQKLADSKQYYLPINTIEKRRTHRVIVLGIALSIILALAWLDVALDAGLVSIPGVKAVTHFF